MHAHFLSGLVWLFFITPAIGQQQHFGFCFSKLKEADSDGNLQLSPTEYAEFLALFTNDAVSDPISDHLFEPFRTMAADNTNLAIDGVNSSVGSELASLVSRLCHTVKSALMNHFGVSIVFDSCLGALKAADTMAPSGYLMPDPEYVQFMAIIAGDTLGGVVNYDDLPKLVKYTFLDMAIGGMIAGPEGADYLQEFCDRALLASTMEASVKVVSEKEELVTIASGKGAPVDTPSDPSHTPSLAPNVAKATDEKTIVAQTPAAPKAAFELTAERFESCLKDIMLSDINRNDLLERREFERFTNRLNNQVFGSNVDSTAEVIIDEAYQNILTNQGMRVAVSVAGSKPARKPTRKEKKLLEFVCKTAHEAIRDAYSAESEIVDEDESAGGELGASHFDKFFETCKISMFASDKDKDSYLDQEEFAQLIARLIRTKELDFRSMDESFRWCFREASKGGKIDVSGTSPVAATSVLQYARLQSVCRKIDIVITAYNQENKSDSSIGNEDVLVRNNDLQSQFPGLTEEFFRLCTMAMYIADDNRDDALSASEFVTFVGRLTFDKSTNLAYDDLDEMFHVVHEDLSETNGLIDIHGSKPGQERNFDQEKMLRHICYSMNGAISDSERFSQASETDSGNYMEDAASASHNGAPTTSPIQTVQSNQVNEVESPVVATIATSPPIGEKADTTKPPKSPSKDKPKPSAQNSQIFTFNRKTFSSPDDMSFTKFDRCKAKIRKADDDADSYLSQDEYLALLKFLGKKLIRSSSFVELSIALQTPFLILAVDQPSVGVYGTHIGETPTNMNIERLERFCSDIYSAIFYHESEQDVDLDCLASMRVADYNEDRSLDEDEFVRFLNIWTMGRFQGLSISGLPFQLKAHYNWSSTFEETFSIKGSSLVGELERDVDALDEFCGRATSSIQTLTPPTSLAEYCQVALETSDSNRDGKLSKKEYLSFLNVFTDELWEPPKRFMKLDQELRDIYMATVGDNVSLEIKLHMTNFCNDVEAAVSSILSKQNVMEKCRTSLLSGDTDSNGRLNSQEFCAVLFDLSFPGGLVGRQRSFQFVDLNDSIQLFFGTMTRGEADLDLSTFRDLKSQNTDDVEILCGELFETVVPELKSSFVPVYNSFLIGTNNNATSEEFESDYELVVLERAYARFVSGNFGRRRKTLEVFDVAPSSPSIDLVDTVECPLSLDDQISRCAVVFGHFNAIVFGNVDEIALSADLSTQFQALIDSGVMQKHILSVDPQFKTKVLRSSIPVKPGELTDETMRESFVVESGTVMMMIFSVITALIFIGIGFYYGRRLALRQKVDVEMSRNNGEKLIDSADREDFRRLSEKDRRAKEDYIALRAYIVPLLLSQAYHLPGYSYGEDLFQYIYNRHPILGLIWRHPLHPIETKVRIVCLLGSVCFGLAISNLIYLVFVFSGWDFEKNYFSIATGNISLHGHLDSEVDAAVSSFSNGNLALWTIGSALHALFDNTLWSLAMCNCASKRGIMEQLNEYKRIGAMSVSLYVTGIIIIAIVTVGVRITISNGDEASQAREAATATFADYDFLTAYALEIFIGFFFFYPLMGFIMFSGFLRCIHPRIFGGRRQEIMSREQENRRQDRLSKRQFFLHDGKSDPRRSFATTSTESESLNCLTYDQTPNYGYDEDVVFWGNRSMVGDYDGRLSNVPATVLEEERIDDAIPDFLSDDVIDTRSRHLNESKGDDLDSVAALNVAQQFLDLLAGGKKDRGSVHLQSDGSHSGENSDNGSVKKEDRGVLRGQKKSRGSLWSSRSSDHSHGQRPMKRSESFSSSSSHSPDDRRKRSSSIASTSSVERSDTRSRGSKQRARIDGHKSARSLHGNDSVDSFSESSYASENSRSSDESSESRSYRDDATRSKLSSPDATKSGFSKSRSFREDGIGSESLFDESKSSCSNDSEIVEDSRKARPKTHRGSRRRKVENDDDKSHTSNQGDWSVSQSESSSSSSRDQIKVDSQRLRSSAKKTNQNRTPSVELSGKQDAKLKRRGSARSLNNSGHSAASFGTEASPISGSPSLSLHTPGSQRRTPPRSSQYFSTPVGAQHSARNGSNTNGGAMARMMQIPRLSILSTGSDHSAGPRHSILSTGSDPTMQRQSDPSRRLSMPMPGAVSANYGNYVSSYGMRRASTAGPAGMRYQYSPGNRAMPSPGMNRGAHYGGRAMPSPAGRSRIPYPTGRGMASPIGYRMPNSGGRGMPTSIGRPSPSGRGMPSPRGRGFMTPQGRNLAYSSGWNRQAMSRSPGGMNQMQGRGGYVPGRAWPEMGGGVSSGPFPGRRHSMIGTGGRGPPSSGRRHSMLAIGPGGRGSLRQFHQSSPWQEGNPAMNSGQQAGDQSRRQSSFV